MIVINEQERIISLLEELGYYDNGSGLANDYVKEHYNIDLTSTSKMIYELRFPTPEAETLFRIQYSHILRD